MGLFGFFCFRVLGPSLLSPSHCGFFFYFIFLVISLLLLPLRFCLFFYSMYVHTFKSYGVSWRLTSPRYLHLQHLDFKIT